MTHSPRSPADNEGGSASSGRVAWNEAVEGISPADVVSSRSSTREAAIDAMARALFESGLHLSGAVFHLETYRLVAEPVLDAFEYTPAQGES